MKRIYSIDALKFVCAVLVVFLHVGTPYSEFVLPVTRCAVPCFFIISGYLIFNADREILEGHLRRGINRTFCMMVWSTALFAVVKFMFAFWRNDFSFLNWNALWKFVFLNENPFGFHLWYIGAYLYTLAIVIFAVKKNRLKLVYQAVPLLLLADLCFGKYSIVLWHREFPYILLRNFLFVGIPYFAIGMLIKQYKDIILNNKKLHLLTLGGGNFIFININIGKTRPHQSGNERNPRPLYKLHIFGGVHVSFLPHIQTKQAELFVNFR